MTTHESDRQENPFHMLQERASPLFALDASDTKASPPAQTIADGYVIASLVSFGVFALALWSPAIFNDADTWWHVRAGQWMLAHGSVLDHDIFSRAFFGKPWVTQEWLSEVLMATAWQLAGWSGVAILTGAAMAAAVLPLAVFLNRRLDPLPCIAALVLGVACVMPDFLARPHILALPCLSVWMIGLTEAASAHRRPSWLLLPVVTIWANLHGSFVFGLALLIPMAIDAAWDDEKDRLRIGLQWAIFAAAAIAAALINPHGASGLLYPFELMQVKSLAAVGEWQPLDLRQFNPVEFAALAAAFFFIWRGMRVRPMRLLLLIALFHQSLVHARYGLFLGIVAPVLLADALTAALGRQESAPNSDSTRATAVVAVVAGAMVMCAALRILLPIERPDGPASPIAAIAAVPASLANAPVFNNYTFGGYLIFRGIEPLVDSRADFYGDAWLSDYWRVVSGDRAAVDRIFGKYDVRWTLLAPGDPLVRLLDSRPGWHRLFTGTYAIVHARLDNTTSARDVHFQR